MDASTDQLAQAFEELAALAATVAQDLSGPIGEYQDVVLEVLHSGGKLLFCGNGGSAADAQHLATEYVVRFERDRRPLRAVALTTDTSLLTAASNDLGYEGVFARQVQALGDDGDLLVLHSTSGESDNLVQAARTAREIGVRTVALLAKGGGRLKELVDVSVVVPTESTARAQEIHLAIGHEVCRFVETRFAVVELLVGLRAAEKDQTLFYRGLAALAEETDQAEASERLNGLYADEQHHLSRLTARLLELGVNPSDLTDVPRPQLTLNDWEGQAKQREANEVQAYELALETEGLDSTTAGVLREILESERLHHAELGGKWMPAT